MRTHILDPNFQGKKVFRFNFLVQFLIYLYLETKQIIITPGIILHTGIVIAFQSYTFNT